MPITFGWGHNRFPHRAFNLDSPMPLTTILSGSTSLESGASRAMRQPCPGGLHADACGVDRQLPRSCRRREPPQRCSARSRAVRQSGSPDGGRALPARRPDHPPRLGAMRSAIRVATSVTITQVAGSRGDAGDFARGRRNAGTRSYAVTATVTPVSWLRGQHDRDRGRPARADPRRRATSCRPTAAAPRSRAAGGHRAGRCP